MSDRRNHLPGDRDRPVSGAPSRLRPGRGPRGDHYAYFDRRLTPIHYLRFRERTWRIWNNGLQHQNRLRPDDFLELAEREGLQIVLNRQPRPELLARFEELPIAPEFRHYPRAQLCTTSVDFVARAPR